MTSFFIESFPPSLGDIVPGKGKYTPLLYCYNNYYKMCYICDDDDNDNKIALFFSIDTQKAPKEFCTS